VLSTIPHKQGVLVFISNRFNLICYAIDFYLFNSYQSRSVLSTSEADHPQKLENLKTKIKNSGLTKLPTKMTKLLIEDNPGLTWCEYSSASDLAEQVKADLLNIVNQDFPAASKPSKLESEEAIMRMFAAKKTRYDTYRRFFTVETHANKQ